MNKARRAARKEACTDCAAIVSTSGFAATAHQRGAAHIAALVANGHVAEAARLQAEANAVASNRPGARAARVAARGPKPVAP